MRRSTSAHDFGALNWVKEELDETIRQARCSLEEYVENPEALSAIQTCIKGIHQVQGILHMVQLYGPAMLGEEMELVAAALQDGAVQHKDDAAEALMLALIQFPDYLEKLQGGEPDIPLIILPLLNDLRATRDAPLLSEAALFSTDLEGTTVPDRVDGDSNPQLPAFARSIRRRYHLGLLNWFRNMDDARGFRLLANVLDELAQHAGSEKVHRLFWVARAVVEGLKEGDVGSGVAVKLLLGKVDREIKRIIDGGEAAVIETPATELLKNLLYYVAQSQSENPYLEEVKSTYQLHNALPSEEEISVGRQSLNALNSDLLDSIKAAIQHELMTVKDTLDLYIRSDRLQIEPLLRIEQPLRKVADTLGMVGQGALRARLIRQAEGISQLEADSELDDNRLMEMAGDILFVESTVNSLSEITSVASDGGDPDAAWGEALPPGEYEALVAKAVHEAKVDIAKAKEAIVNFVASPDEPTLLTDVPHYFQNVCGALKILLLTDASDILEQLSRFIDESLLTQKAQLDTSHLNALAEVISSIEYYLEFLVEGVGDRDEILALAHSSLIEVLVGTSHEEAQTATTTEREVEEELLSEPILERSSAAPLSESSEEEPLKVSPPSIEKPALEDIDPEILEIFVEEAREELEGLSLLLPRWKQNPSDHETLITIRRSFHTLKGSGRLVGAMTIGELAWFVEKMLSRVLDETISSSPEMLQLLEEIVEILPHLIDCQEQLKPPTVDVQHYMARVSHLSEGKTTPTETQQTDELPGEPEQSKTPQEEEDLAVDPDYSPPQNQDSIGYERDSELIEIFEAEVQTHFSTLDTFITTGEISGEPQAITDEVIRACHTLRGCARTAGIEPMAQIGEALENFSNAAQTSGLLIGKNELALIKEGVNLDRSLLAAMLYEDSLSPDPAPYLALLQNKIEMIESGEEQTSTSMEAIGTLSTESESTSDVAANTDATLEALASVIELNDDEDLLEIFLEEAQELIERLNTCVRQWRNGREEWTQLIGLQRTLHTLKGSARLVGASPIGNLSHAIESLLTAHYQRQIVADDSHVELIQEGIDRLSSQAKEIQHSNRITHANDLISQLLTATENLTTTQKHATDQETDALTFGELDETDLDQQPEPLESDLLDAAYEATLQPDKTAPCDVDPKVTEIEGSEVGSESNEQPVEITSETIDEFNTTPSEFEEGVFESTVDLPTLDASDSDQTQSSDEITNLHQQEESSEPASLPEATLPSELDSGISSTERADDSELTDEFGPLSIESEFVDSELLETGELHQLGDDKELIEIFLEEAHELLESLAGTTQHWLDGADNSPTIEQLLRALHTLKGSARMAGAQPVGDLSHAVESLLSLVDRNRVEASKKVKRLVQQSIDRLASQIDEIEKNHCVGTADGLIDRLQQVGGSEPDQTKEIPSPDEIEPADKIVASDETSGELELESISVESEFADSMLLESGESYPLGDDDELIDIFIEEAHDLTETLETALLIWIDGEESATIIDQLQRTLHTLKGSARLAGAQPVGDLCHALESLLSLVETEKLEASIKVKQLVQQSIDRLASQVDEIKNHRCVGTADALIDRLRLISSGEFDQFEEVEDKERASEAELEPTQQTETAPEPEPELEIKSPQPTPVYKQGELISRFAAQHEEEQEGNADKSSPQPQVRVNSDSLDQMVNQAGEVSIYRSRLEQQNSSLKFNLQELDRTVTRLHEQLRHLDIETETQILFRHEGEIDEAAISHSDFDPLELDRFSTMQQLSRSLMETVSDLGSIGGLLDDQQRETETLLLQQSRVSVSLQDSLLHTRMVPFSQLVPRLSRVVRQTAIQTGREAELSVTGADGEMDRSILNRMIPALEHLLRNAVSHGIEPPHERAERGKPVTGQISLDLRHEGTNVHLTLKDDGAGLDLQAIHKRALSHGLIDPGTEVSDDDLMQLILESGFSTAKEVTQIAGRGVGMDAVSNEVKQLGGMMELGSTPGKGTHFTIQLPLTLAITDALLVEMGDHIYAVPHGSIEGAVRISREDLLNFYADPELRYHYADHEYKVDYLGNLLATGAPLLLEGERWFPLLLVHVGEHRIALQVDGLLGTRQVVVKGIGSQIGTLRWITGGTILGDGRVALIMDMSALVRTTSTHALTVQTPQIEDETVGVTAMVVDDSITVRKVTSRLLERHNMQVITAKDGVDAISMLQDHHPDVLLLDIEMPRMDGFELARHMRNSPAWSDIPIIMISSRVGDKHRDRAFDLGVKSCLGKPYQETELLENIYAVLSEETT